MDRFGFIRDKNDIKYLILYVMSLLNRPLPLDQIAECSMCDDGFGYFEFCDAFAELERDGNISRDGGTPVLYELTENGKAAAQVFYKTLPTPVQERARLLAAKLGASILRNAVVRTGHEALADGSVRVRLGYMDGDDPVFSFELLVGSVRQAVTYEENFRRHAEKMYDGILCVLTNDYSPEDDEE